MCSSDLDEHGKYGTTTYLRRFGRWFNALEKAGLEKTRTSYKLSEEELFKNLEEVWIKLGRQPKHAEVHKPLSKYHVGTYENHFILGEKRSKNLSLISTMRKT